MTADDRLNQLEPLLSEALTVLDRHTHQLKQLSSAVGQLTTAVAQQGDNIGFLLQEQLGMKTDIAGMKTEMTGMNAKLDLLIELIQNPNK